jgi:hypothetical protein
MSQHKNFTMTYPNLSNFLSSYISAHIDMPEDVIPDRYGDIMQQIINYYVDVEPFDTINLAMEEISVMRKVLPDQGKNKVESLAILHFISDDAYTAWLDDAVEKLTSSLNKAQGR